jgi:microcystin degradation protein MlrC
MVRKIESQRDIIDASAWVGYAWADERRSHAYVAVTGWNKSTVRHGAEELARLFWDSREEFHFVAPTASFDDCFDKALECTSRPYFISDSGDNPTAGGSGDVTWTLRRLIALLKQHRGLAAIGSKFIYASLPSAGAVATAVEAGLATHVTVTVVAGIDDDCSDSLTLTGVVYAIKHGDADAETEVVLELAGLPVFVILTKLRKPYHFEHDFTDLSLDIGKANANAIIIVKIGYLEPELYDLAKGWMLALTPGGVDQNLLRLGHKRIMRPMWPYDKRFKKDPDLTARIVGRGDGK